MPRRGENTGDAKAVCATCSVTTECLSFALVTFEKNGIWGGLSERERRVIRGRLTRQGVLQAPREDIDHGTAAGYFSHRRRGEQPCRMCMEARNAADHKLAETA